MKKLQQYYLTTTGAKTHTAHRDLQIHVAMTTGQRADHRRNKILGYETGN